MAGTRKLTVEILGDARGISSAVAEVEEKTGRMHGAFSALSVAGGEAFTRLGAKALEFGKNSIEAASHLSETSSQVKQIFGTMAEASAVATEKVMADKNELSKAEEKYADAVESMQTKTGKARETAAAKVEEWRKKVEAAQNQVTANEKANAEAHEKFMASGSKLSDEYAKQIERFAAAAAKSFGLSKQQSLDASNTFATFGKAAGMSGQELVDFSTKLTGLSADMASFKDTSPDEAIEAIGAALRGESEPIRKYGVLLNDASLKAKAMELGLYSGKGALDAQAKTMATYQLILEKTKDAQGDFGRTSSGEAGRQKILDAQMANLSATIGQKLIPVKLALTNATLKLVEAVSKGIEVISPFVSALGEKLAPVVEKVGNFLKDNATPALVALGVVLGGAVIAGVVAATNAVIAFNVALLANPIVLVVAGLAALAAGVVYAYEHFETFRNIVDGVGRFMRDTVLPIITGFVGAVRTGFEQLLGFLSPLWEPIKQAWSSVWSSFVGLFGTAWGLATSAVTGALGHVKEWISGIIPDVSGAWNGMWDSLKGAAGDDGPWGVVRGALTGALGTVKGWVGDILEPVGNMWASVWGNLKFTFGNPDAWPNVMAVVVDALKGPAQWVWDIATGLWEKWTNVWEGLKSKFSAVWDGDGGIGSVIGGALSLLSGAFGGVSTAISKVIEWIGKIHWPSPPAWLSSFLGKAGDVGGGIVNAVTGGNNPASAAPVTASASSGGGLQPIGNIASNAPAGTQGLGSGGQVLVKQDNGNWAPPTGGGSTVGAGSSSAGGGAEGDVVAGGGSPTGSGVGSGGGSFAGASGGATVSDPFAGASASGAAAASGGALGAAADAIGDLGDDLDGDGLDDQGTPGPEPEPAPTSGSSSREKAILDLIAFTEGTDFGMGHGYHTLLGGSYFESLAKHPNIKVKTKWGTGDAAGRYQFEKASWDWWAGKLGLTDFSEGSQDKAALAYIKYVLDLKKVSINDPISEVLKALSGTWTSLPGGKQPAGRTPLAFKKWSELTGEKVDDSGASPGADKYAELYKNGLHFLERDQKGYRFAEDGLVVTPAINQFALNLKHMQADAAKSGHKITMFSGFRSKARQAKLYADDVRDHGGKPSGYVAKNSRHSLGIAMDISGDKPWAWANAAKYGLWFPISPHEPRFKGKHKEDWHMEPAGSRSWFAEGGYVDSLTFATMGEAGPEAVLPLTNPERMAQLLSDSRIAMPVMIALSETVGHPVTFRTGDENSAVNVPVFRTGDENSAVNVPVFRDTGAVGDPSGGRYVSIPIRGVPSSGVGDAASFVAPDPAAPDYSSWVGAGTGSVIPGVRASDYTAGRYAGSTVVGTGGTVVGSGGTVIQIGNLIGELSVTGDMTNEQARRLALNLMDALEEVAVSRGRVTVDGAWRLGS